MAAVSHGAFTVPLDQLHDPSQGRERLFAGSRMIWERRGRAAATLAPLLLVLLFSSADSGLRVRRQRGETSGSVPRFPFHEVCRDSFVAERAAAVTELKFLSRPKCLRPPTPGGGGGLGVVEGRGGSCDGMFP